MTVGELFKELRWEAVEKAIVTLYPDEKPVLPAYKEVFAQVRERELSSDESGMTVHIKFVPESDFSEAHYSVDGKIPGDDDTYALDFSTFSQWAAYLLSEETLTSLPPEEIAAHVLYEMTFYGFSDDVIQQKKEGIGGGGGGSRERKDRTHPHGGAVEKVRSGNRREKLNFQLRTGKGCSYGREEWPLRRGTKERISFSNVVATSPGGWLS